MFENGETVYRDRRKTVADRYSTATTLGPWDDVDTIPIEGAYVAPGSSAPVRTPTRAQAETSVALFCDPGADIEVGDRIRHGGHTWYVNEVPANHGNPFTGWNPMQEVQLDRTEG